MNDNMGAIFAHWESRRYQAFQAAVACNQGSSQTALLDNYPEEAVKAEPEIDLVLPEQLVATLKLLVTTLMQENERLQAELYWRDLSIGAEYRMDGHGYSAN